MFPVCFSSVAWLIAGGVSVLGATAGGVAIVRDWKTQVMHSGADESDVQRRDICAQPVSQAQQ
jgi:hypothetical protein